MLAVGLLAVGDEAVNVAHEVRERVGPRFLMTAGQVRVRPRLRVQERRIFLQNLVRTIAMADPQLVLVLLPPPQRRRRAADLEHEIVLVAGADLADREAPLRAVVEPDEDACEILDLDVDEIVRLVLPRRLKRLARSARLLPPRHDRRQIAEDVRDAESADVLREIAPVRPDVAERGRGAP